MRIARAVFTVILLFALTGATTLAAAPRTTIKLGTIAPKGSSFEKVLTGMGSEWAAQGVDLKIYSGGNRGGEADMVRQMRNGVLDAGLLTAVGLSDIDRSVEGLQSIPMLFGSMDEVDYVGEQLRPRLETRLRDKGFVVLFWADTGWVRFFSKQPLIHPADARKAKLFVWAGDITAVEAYEANGFHPVALETNDILPSLQTGMINAVPLPPYVALATQVFRHAPYMLDLDWAPLVGALVITEKKWNQLTPDVQRQLARAAAESGRRMKATNRRESDLAVVEMQKRGLHVTPVSPAIIAEWRDIAERSYPRIRGSKIPADLFDEVVRLVKSYRANTARIASSK
jgi:TRAP-type C4-dicarboxylate transport system substrate-binding protein